ncbi:MAG: tetratricopeptide repeat protein [Calditrichaeota bacterium]|nr:tetratricopeptide repeat protein [Calditrichota bacterium]MCB9365839.1 tetratricopeptide repeat protein [Calditrichota bacterium]
MWRRLIAAICMLPVLVFAAEPLPEDAAALCRAAMQTARQSSPQAALLDYDFAAFRALLPELTATASSPQSFEPLLDWYVLTEDLPELERWAPHSAYPEIAEGRLAYALLNFERADSLFRAGLKYESPIALRLSKIGLSEVLQKQQKYEDALELLRSACTLEEISDEVLFQAGLCKIRLGEISDAISMFETCTECNPRSEMAHYYLGNGYVGRNYRELEATSEHLKCNGDAICAREFVVDGSDEWMRGEFESALHHFAEALKYVPDYGRAHNGIAKCLEQFRLRENVYRAADQAAFDARPLPVIPQIEQYVLNWESLSERHRKQVALSVEPWKAYIPVLVATGSHHYIKPLHEKLSECPGLETIADQRITYDSRLWDDVRGCGGYTTVTGIEDVERSIYNKYNTVLHELTHQVHGVFPPVDQERIDSLYREASAQDASGAEIFVSRYQGSSVWEYFAEGMNSYFSPRRNDYDTREITKERLFKLDPQLVSLLEAYMSGSNVESCYAVGFVNAAENDVEQGKLATAMGFARQAEQREPDAEVVLREISKIASYSDSDDVSLDYARKLLDRYPEKAESHVRMAQTQLFADGDFGAARKTLSHGLSKTSGSERTRLTRELAAMTAATGNYGEAVVNYRVVLAERGTDDTALRGYAGALFGLGKVQQADSMYQVALKRRNGVVGLRLEYARMLLLTGRLEEARAQIDEAELLTPGNGRVEIHRQWLNGLSGLGVRDMVIRDALAAYPDDAIVQAIAAYLTGESTRDKLLASLDDMVPTWVFNPIESSYEARNYWDAEARAILKEDISKFYK